MHSPAPPLVIDRRTLLAGLAALPMLGAARAAAAAEPQVSFLVLGDWGRGGAPVQRQVAEAMARAAIEVGSRFVVSVGDNFYPQGVVSADDPQWRSSFEEVYAEPSLQTPWYVALGNHDYRGDPQAQIDYSRRSDRWRMPARYFKVGGDQLGAPWLDIFVMDTSMLVQGEHETEAQLAHGRLWLPLHRRRQLRWLDRELAASTARWKVVVGHHPLYSGGHHGGEPLLVRDVQPLLERHGVQLYLNGHDHDLQHVARNGVHYACAGSGSGAGRALTPVEGSLFGVAAPGFAIVTSSASGLSLQFRDVENAPLHQASLATERALA